jgi:hypothetical protein
MYADQIKRIRIYYFVSIFSAVLQRLNSLSNLLSSSPFALVDFVANQGPISILRSSLSCFLKGPNSFCSDILANMARKSSWELTSSNKDLKNVLQMSNSLAPILEWLRSTTLINVCKGNTFDKMIYEHNLENIASFLGFIRSTSFKWSQRQY